MLFITTTVVLINQYFFGYLDLNFSYKVTTRMCVKEYLLPLYRLMNFEHFYFIII